VRFGPVIIAGRAPEAAAPIPPELLVLGHLEHPLPFDFGALRPRRTVLRHLPLHPSSHLIGAGVQLLRKREFVRAVGRL
jgi:hypothetical protein